MIYTVTFNPSLDYTMRVDGFCPGRTNRAESAVLGPGGKGINVSVMLKNLGAETLALGFTAGFVGDEIVRSLKECGLNTDFIRLSEGCSRINVKLPYVEGTEINAPGPDIPKEALDMLMDRVRALKRGDCLVLAGSVPACLPRSVYRSMALAASSCGADLAIDAEGSLLTDTLSCRPLLIKPNADELGGLFARTFSSRREVIPYAAKLREAGARNVLVSMAGEGAVMAAENGEIYESPAPRGKLVNGVGAGDSMVAGFLAGYYGNLTLKEAFAMGIAAGSASAFGEGLADREAVLRIYEEIHPLSAEAGETVGTWEDGERAQGTDR